MLCCEINTHTYEIKIRIYSPNQSLFFINSIICFIYLLPHASHPKITHAVRGGCGTPLGSACSARSSAFLILLFLLSLGPISRHSQRIKALWPCALPKQARAPPSTKARLRGVPLSLPAAALGFGLREVPSTKKASRNTAGCMMWNQSAGGCFSLWSYKLGSDFSYLENRWPTPPSQNRASQYLLPTENKEKSKASLLDLLHLGSRLHQSAEQGCLVLERGWFMVSHMLMCYIIHLVLVPMNISSQDKSAGRGANWWSAVF